MTTSALTDIERSRIEANVFRLARPLITKDSAFPWHRDRAGVITASNPISSQALAVDLFESLRTLASWERITNAWMEFMAIEAAGPWRLELERKVPAALLGEPRPTQIDAVLQSDAGIVLFECKFTEPDGGPCSQPELIRKGANKGKRWCTGSYEEQSSPIDGEVYRCALTQKASSIGTLFRAFSGWTQVWTTARVHSRAVHISG